MLIFLAIASMAACAMSIVSGSYFLAVAFAGSAAIFARLNHDHGDETGFFGTLLLLALIGVVLSYCTGSAPPDHSGW